MGEVKKVSFSSAFCIMLTISIVLVALLSWVCVHALELQSLERPDIIPVSESSSTGGLDTYEIHEIVLTIQTSPGIPDSVRHRHEKSQLLSRLGKGSGTWNTNHPRHRLLQALHGFRRYYERNVAELERWKGLYKHVSKQHRKVSLNAMLSISGVLYD